VSNHFVFPVIFLGLLAALPGWAQPSAAPSSESGNQLIPAKIWNKRPEMVVLPEGQAIRMDKKFSLAWEMPGAPIWGAEYEFRFRVKAENAGSASQPSRIVLWARLPDQHEPPKGGIISTKSWFGTLDWETRAARFRMPPGVSRFMIFFDAPPNAGFSDIDGLSLSPVDDRPLPLDTAHTYGSTDREPMLWIWSAPGFRGAGEHMGQGATQPASREKVLFRRTIRLPGDARNVQAVFCGDDQSSLTVNGRPAGGNQMAQDIARAPLDGLLKEGENTFVFEVDNDLGPAGLIGRIEWTAPDGKRTLAATNDRWECSADGGATWKQAIAVAAPVPASLDYAWCYPHLEKISHRLTFPLPDGLSSARIAMRATGGFEVAADGRSIFSASSSGTPVRAYLGDALNGAKEVSITMTDIEQPPAGQGTLEIQTGGETRFIPLGEFLHDGKPPKEITALFPSRTWPLGVIAFEAAATRPIPDLTGRLEPWAEKTLAGATEIFRLGRDDNSSGEFGPIKDGAPSISLPPADTSEVPRGLEAKWLPELTLHFSLPKPPPHGAAFALDVEDADTIATSVGIFVNGIFCGNPQIIGYDQFPGGRLTNRTWLVTIPKERFTSGANTITLRLLPPYYASGAGTENQAEEYIKLFRLGDRAANPYPSSAWIHWDSLTLYALGKPAADVINGRPVWLGASTGYIISKGLGPWNEFVLRDLCYLGLEGNDAPFRHGIWNKIPPEGKPDPLIEQFASLRARGIRPFLLMEPGRGVKTPAEIGSSNEAAAVRRYGASVDTIEVGNEVDHPRYGWDSLSLAAAHATIQRQAAAGQALKKEDPDGDLKITGEGWYHAWDFSVIDAQARQEAPGDPAWTDHLSAHSYGKSYIIPALTYYMLYGVNPPAPIWVTECGAHTDNDKDIGAFDLNMRGNLAYASRIVAYLTHPYSKDMRKFSLFSAERADAEVLEKARCFRRYVNAFGLHGQPLPWQYTDPAAMKDKLVLVNAVHTGALYKITVVNFSREPQQADFSVTLPESGTFPATRHGDGRTVAEGTRSLELQASPEIAFREQLNPGEAVEYLLRK